MSVFLSKLLKFYNLSEDDYNYMSRPLSEVTLKDPKKIEGMDRVVERINKAIENKEKIAVYGDYDCDGVSATSIMVLTFKKLGYPITSYIPSRYKDGYGINVSQVERIAKAGYSLIITVDNGIAAHDAVNRANELGVDVIVVDHHEVEGQPTNAYAIIHPTVSHISEIIGSGGYMSLFVSAALLGYYDDYLVTLAGLSVVTDLMELKDYNRDVVRLALNNLKQKGYLPLRLLLDSPIITEKTFSLDLGPKINAVGRIEEDPIKLQMIVKYFTSENRDELFRLRDEIIGYNEQRKTISADAIKCLPNIGDEKGICICTNMKEGLVGLAANRLMTTYLVPTIVFTNSEDESIIKGSMRSKEGFDLTKALVSLKKYLVTGGGHAYAGGVSIKRCDFDAFKADFIELCEEHPIVESIPETIELELKDISLTNYEEFRSLAPYGMGFVEPTFLIRNIATRGLDFISCGKHLSTNLSINTKLLGFNMNEGEIKANRYINIYGNLFESSFRGKSTIEFRINNYSVEE